MKRLQKITVYLFIALFIGNVQGHECWDLYVLEENQAFNISLVNNIFVNENYSIFINGVLQEEEFYFGGVLVPFGLPEFGEIKILNDITGECCISEYQIIRCPQDFFIFDSNNCNSGPVYFDPDPVYQEDIIFSLLYSDPYSFRRYMVYEASLYVCQGDTTHFDISNKPGYPNFLNSGEYGDRKLTLDRLGIRFGSIINLTEYDFSVHWDGLGFGYVGLKNECNNSNYSDVTIGVHIYPNDRMEIATENGINTDLEVCSGTSVKLVGAFIDSPVIDIGYTFVYRKEQKWEVSDGTVYYQDSIEHTFDTPGEYFITLSNNLPCGCTEPKTIKVTVLEGESPGIQCTGLVCSETESVYYSDIECDQYIWNVNESGTVTAGGGIDDYYISVLWDTGGFGEVSLEVPDCIESKCNTVTEIVIPIIKDDIQIVGLDTVCPNTSERYAIPYMEGTTYRWELNGNAWSSFTTKRNYLDISWSDNFPYNNSVVVHYENCLLDCSGTSILNVTKPSSLYLLGNEREFCVGDQVEYKNRDGSVGNWEIEKPNGQTDIYSNLDALTITFDLVGHYNITLYGIGDYCTESYSRDIEVFDIPIPPTEILGSNLACKGSLNEYSIDGLESLETVMWTIVDGARTETIKQNILSYSWESDGPYEITAAVLNKVTKCLSEPVLFQFEDVATIVGSESTCLESGEIYLFDSGLYQNVDWTIVPSTAGVIIDSNKDSVQIVWLEDGKHQLTGNYCNYYSFIDVTVEPDFEIELNYNQKVCPNEITQLIINVPTNVSFTVFNEDGNILSINSNIELPKGDYKIEAISSLGCVEKRFVHIEEYLSSSLTIYSADNTVFSVPHPGVRLDSEALDDSYSYQWFRDGLALNETKDSIITAVHGSYFLEATDLNGCITTSNYISLRAPSGGSTSTSSVQLLLPINQICGEGLYKIEQPYNSTAFNWSFGDPDSGFDNNASGIEVFHEFSKIGFYPIVVVGNAQEISATQVRVPAKLGFDIQQGCQGDTTFFIDQTSFIKGLNGLTYSWSFGDPSSGIDNNSDALDPFHIYNQAGLYSVTLEIIGVTECIAIFSKEILVAENPEIVISSRDKTCDGTIVEFDVVTNSLDLSYAWNFGDSLSGLNNFSDIQKSNHIFSREGFYEVSLTTENIYGCTITQTKNIEVTPNDLNGNIVSTALVKCTEDYVELTAPSGGTKYLWSTGETSSTISVIQPGEYFVTIENTSGCKYSPQSIYIENQKVELFTLNGVIISRPGFNVDSYEEILEVCSGQEFSLRAIFPKITNGEYSYQWSNGYSEKGELEYEEHFEGLGPGSYDFMVTVSSTDPVNCSRELGPFEVVILESPQRPIISADNDSPCNDHATTLTIDNFSSDLSYQWSTGETTQSIVVSSVGLFSVVVYDSKGCMKSGGYYEIHEVPIFRSWMTGCVEMCFPKRICIDFDYYSDQYLIKDGIVYDSINTDEIEIIEPGEYQLQIVNRDGCSLITDVLSLTAKPNDHSLDGIIYYDEDNDNIYNNIDTLLGSIPVYLYNGNTIVDSTTTDVNGYYEFPTIDYTNLTVVINTEGLNYNFTTGTDTLLVYQDCIEDKVQDFPLTNDCSEFTSNDTLRVCQGFSVIVEGVEYFEGDTDTLTFKTLQNCDSLVIFMVEAFDEPVLNLDILESCINAPTGQLSITSDNIAGLQFSLNGSMYSNVSEFLELGAGSNTLSVKYESGCESSIPFEVVVSDIPVINLEVEAACEAGTSTGGVTCVNEDSDPSVRYSIDGIDYVESGLFQDFPAGSYSIFVQYDQGCVHEIPFQISNSIAPVLDLVTTSTCWNDSNGSLNIENTNTSNLEYSLDGNNYTDGIAYNGLSTGSQNLYIRTDVGCVYQQPFEIMEDVEPSIVVVVPDVCPDVTMGTITIESALLDDLSFSLDGIIFSSAALIENVPIGSYTLYTQTEQGCILESPVVIEQQQSPVYTLDIQSSCSNESSGQLIISSEDPQLQYSLDGVDFNNQIEWPNLAVGNYILYVDNGLNCITESAFSVTELLPAVVTTDVVEPCPQESNGMIIVASDDPLISISLDNSEFAGQNSLDDLASGQYEVFIQDQNGCIQSAIIDVVGSAALTVDFLPVDLDCNSDQATLEPVVLNRTGIPVFEWSTGAVSEIIVIEDSGEYSVTVTDNCSQTTHRWDISFPSENTEERMYLPNAFSPNNDGANDCFKVFAHDDIVVESYNLNIYDRWGGLMYTSDRIQDCWDGTFRGKPALNGVYVYQLAAVIQSCNQTKEITKVGDLNILR